MSDPDNGHVEPTPEEVAQAERLQRTETIRSLVIATYTRMTAREEGRPLTHMDVEVLIESHKHEIAADVANLVAVCDQAFSSGASFVHTTLHAAETIDHDMLDEIAECAALMARRGW